MKRQCYQFISILLICVLSFATPMQPIAFAEASDDDEPSFARGARAWAETCARCHNMRDPQEFTDEEWRVIMAHMRIRANLTGQEMRDILAFLQGAN